MRKLTSSDTGIGPNFEFLESEKPLALAVSGGSDSMALLRLAHEWAAQHSVDITALTVDHALRDESAAEAAQVADWCGVLGIRHQTLRWDHDDIPGNLSEAAREARYRLLSEFCATAGISTLATGHTRDDQAETVLMRLARGSGVDGLAAMALDTSIWGVRVVRPLLEVSREALREYLRGLGQGWIEDPSNDNTAYDRVKTRQALELLAPLGVTADRLVRTARMMGMARDALEVQAAALMSEAVLASPIGYVTVDPIKFRESPRETALRVLADLLRSVSGAVHRPRLDALEDVLDWVCSAPETGGRSLHGCLLRPKHQKLLILREPSACSGSVQAVEGENVWDGRFKLTANPIKNATIAMLGEAGLAQIPKDFDSLSVAWEESPRESRLTTPGLWRGDQLLVAPLAPWSAEGAPTVSAMPLWPASC